LQFADIFPHAWNGKRAQDEWEEAEHHLLGANASPRTTVPPALFEALSAQVRAWKTQAVQLERDGALLHALDEERILAESGSRHVDEVPRFGQNTEKETILCKFKFSNSSVFPEKETILKLVKFGLPTFAIRNADRARGPKHDAQHPQRR
jgi:hypothetical protein